MTHERVPVRGGCLCGAVRYECAEPPTGGFFCHCTSCQRYSGSLFSATVQFAGSAFRLTKGELTYYRSSTMGKRSFCANCGSPVAFAYDDLPNVWIKIGSLDHPEDWPMTKEASWGPSIHLHTDTKVPWHDINDGLPQQGRYR